MKCELLKCFEGVCDEQLGMLKNVALPRRNVDWSNAGVRGHHVLYKICNTKYLSLQTFYIYFQDCGGLNVKSSDTSINGAVDIKPLDKSFASLLTQSWKYCDEATLKMIQTLIELNRAFGVFSEGCSSPVAWMLIYG